MQTWSETRRHPLDVAQNLYPVEAYERQFYEEAKSPYRGLVWLAMVAICGVVWFWGTMMIVVFLVGG